ncbi:carboxypeptidase-like regulatory domain-containing protein [Rheinheimera sp. KL1]|uniref:carboxypeptidase-like regulatory domain-containing protein n=1 Tax=Rheinheimera sp. KL1 TaxID=1635005 RepID=UPI000AB1DC3C|nr:carboxypeptidase-like regulatory domain-containing protein [Rheinheimera sp. KL1]
MANKLKLSRIAFAVAATLGVMSSVQAQETSSNITGRILTPAGAPAQGTMITIIHEPSGTSKSATVGQNGSFSAKGLRVGGPYKVVVDSQEFQDTTVEKVFLSLGEATTSTLHYKHKTLRLLL